ncbi:hypothetical protein Tco_1502525 [Tanacetum coccineum]
MSSYNRHGCFKCGGLFGGLYCRQCTCEQCRRNYTDEVCDLCCYEVEKSFVNDSNPNSFIDSPNIFNPPPQPQTYSCKFCGNNAHYGYDCPPQVSFIYNLEPCFNQNFDNNFPQTSQSLPQQFPCCENYGGPHENFQCQPINQKFHEPNLCYNSISSGFDQFQPPQFPVIHQSPQEMSIQDMEDLKQQYLDEMKSLINEIQIKNYHNKKIDIEIKINELKENFNRMSIEINKKKKLQQLDSLTAITPNSPITDSLIMEDEHLDTISEIESDEEYESSVENLNLTPRESEDLSDIESECDVPICDDFTTSSNPLFDSYDDSTFSDDESFSDENVPKENFKIYSNPLFDEEIISTKIDLHHFNAEIDLIESLLNRDTSIVSSPKFDSLLEEFSGELAHIDLISPEIDEADFDPEEEIRLVEKLLYDNSSPRPPKELNSDNSDVVIESFSPSPIPIEGSDSLMEEIDIFLTPDDSIPPGIENDDYDSEGDILEELLNNDSLSLPENESFYFDRYYDPSSPRPPVKPPDDDGIYFDVEADTGILTVKVVDDISERYVLKPRILHTQLILSLCPVIDTLLPFSFEMGTTFSILPDDDLWRGHSYLGCSVSSFLSSLTNSSMRDRVRLKTRIALDFEDSRARGLVLRLLELQSLA